MPRRTPLRPEQHNHGRSDQHVALTRKNRKGQFVSRLYHDIPWFYHDTGAERGVLRVNALPYLDTQKLHIREWFYKRGQLWPGRGVTFDLEQLDEVIYALMLIREDVDHGRLATTPAEIHDDEPTDDDDLRRELAELRAAAVAERVATAGSR